MRGVEGLEYYVTNRSSKPQTPQILNPESHPHLLLLLHITIIIIIIHMIITIIMTITIYSTITITIAINKRAGRGGGLYAGFAHQSGIPWVPMPKGS